MYNHFIELKPGFHAEAGCKFHAFVKDYCNDDHPDNHDCHIPWEEYQTVPVGEKSPDYDIINQLKNLNFEKPNLQLKIYPNPSNHIIKVLANIIGYNDKCPILLKFYTIDGKLVKNINISNGIEAEININDISSGYYLIASSAEFINKNNKLINLSYSDIIIIEN